MLVQLNGYALHPLIKWLTLFVRKAKKTSAFYAGFLERYFSWNCWKTRNDFIICMNILMMKSLHPIGRIATETISFPTYKLIDKWEIHMWVQKGHQDIFGIINWWVLRRFLGLKAVRSVGWKKNVNERSTYNCRTIFCIIPIVYK